MTDYGRSLPVRMDVPSASENKSTPIGTASQEVKFSQDVVIIEIVNNHKEAIVYININGGTADPGVDLPIFPLSFYAVDRKVLKDTGIALISDTPNTDVRIVGHFTLVPES